MWPEWLIEHTQDKTRGDRHALEAPLEGDDGPDAAAGFILQEDDRFDGGASAWLSSGVERLANCNDAIRAGLNSQMLNELPKRLLADAIRRRKICRSAADRNCEKSANSFLHQQSFALPYADRTGCYRVDC